MVGWQGGDGGQLETSGGLHTNLGPPRRRRTPIITPTNHYHCNIAMFVFLSDDQINILARQC